MLRFAAGPDGLLKAIEAAACFHDLGKLDAQNQAAFASNGRLPWDHIDAGVAHLSRLGNWMAAWIVRAHHAPGLPSRPRHFDPDGLGRRLRGRRWDTASAADHQRQIERTDARLTDYVAAHEGAAGGATVARTAAIGGLIRTSFLRNR
jgi:CRISPR-associated endonuclease/helicase Cas3